MKKFKRSTALLCAVACTVSMSACGVAPSRSELLGEPKDVPSDLTISDKEGFAEFHNGLTSFSSKLTAATYEGQTYAVSPVSVYLALAVASACADGNTEKQLLGALETDRSELIVNYPLLYSSLFEEHKAGNKTIALTEPSNSIWLNTGVSHNDDCIKSLADDFYCYSYSADFANNNAAANGAIKKFVSDKTRGLIDNNFNLSTDTLFTIINTLYLKDVWLEFGDDLGMTDIQYTFSGMTKSTDTKLLSGLYNRCRAYSCDEFNACYTTTAYGNKLLFVVPADGYGLDDVFNAQSINAAISYDYAKAAKDNEQKKVYYTRCLFPEFSAAYDNDINYILKSDFGITDFFDNKKCDLGRLTDKSVSCSKIQHVTKLDVNKKGIEGAAVTVISLVDASAGPIIDDYESVYETFTVDKAFGFAILDSNDTVLFSGAITDINA